MNLMIFAGKNLKWIGEIMPQIKLYSKHYGDTLYIKINPKTIVFSAMIDDCGNTFRISKQELKELI